MTPHFQLGTLVVALSGSGPAVRALHDELASRHTSDGPADLTLHFSSDIPQPGPDAVTVGPVSARPGEAWLRFPNLNADARVTWEAGHPRYEVAVRPPEHRHRLPLALRRWRDPTFLSPPEQQAYGILNGIVEPAMLFFGGRAGLLHSAAVEHQGRAVLLTAAGGAGKTTSELQLVLHHGWRYLADDIVILSGEGPIQPYPRQLMVYRYNCAGDPELEDRLLTGRPWLDRLHWKRSRSRATGVRRRVAPHDLFGRDALAPPTAVGDVLFLSRHGGAEVERLPLDADDLARRCERIIATEYGFYLNYVRWWEATGHAPVRTAEILERHRSIYRSVFQQAGQLTHLRIPASMGPADLGRACLETVSGG